MIKQNSFVLVMLMLLVLNANLYGQQGGPPPPPPPLANGEVTSITPFVDGVANQTYYNYGETIRCESQYSLSGGDGGTVFLITQKIYGGETSITREFDDVVVEVDEGQSVTLGDNLSYFVPASGAESSYVYDTTISSTTPEIEWDFEAEAFFRF